MWAHGLVDQGCAAFLHGYFSCFSGRGCVCGCVQERTVASCFVCNGQGLHCNRMHAVMHCDAIRSEARSVLSS